MKIPTLLVLICCIYAKRTPRGVVDNTLHIVNDTEHRYLPDWSDLDSRPLPEWYDRAKVGIFVHWGVYSVPGYGSEWFWNHWIGGDKNIKDFMKNNYPPWFTYQEFAPMFKAEFFDPDFWAALFEKAGAKYVVLTTKHHDGYTLYPSRRSFSWNALEVGPKRDLVRELATSIRKRNMKFGIYHSLYEWFNPMYLEDKGADFTTQIYPKGKLWPDIKQLINDYKPSVLWADGDWDATDKYWNSTELLAWLYNDSPVKDEIVVNDRWGIGSYCHHGDFFNCADAYNPGELQNHKWENAFPLDSKAWGYRRNIAIFDILSINRLIKEVVTTVSCGGNVLINVGPTKEGTIAPIFQERLVSLGDWLSVNGEAIYGTSPWFYQNDSENHDVWYTCTKTRYDDVHPTAVPRRNDVVTAIYAMFLKWPSDNVLKVRDLWSYLQRGNYQIQLMGNNDTYLKWTYSNGLISIQLPDRSTTKSQHAWALKLFTN
ncbi:tissue alpha-L-fucosidase-like isoform X2 [Epargyreus clarus]